MQLGIIGLGRMGANMARRLMKKGHRCVVHDTRDEAVAALHAEGAVGAADVAEFVANLERGDRLFKRPFFSQNTPRNTPRRALGHAPKWLLRAAPAR